MNLYRLDYVDADGNTLKPVRDPLWRSDYLTRYAKISRQVAIQKCATGPRDSAGIAITRISGAGSTKRVLIVNTQGNARRP